MKSSTEIAFPTEKELRALARGTLNFSRKKEIRELASRNAFVQDAIDGYRIRHFIILKRIMFKAIVPIVFVMATWLSWRTYSSKELSLTALPTEIEGRDELSSTHLFDEKENNHTVIKEVSAPSKNRVQYKLQGAGEEKKRLIIPVEYMKPKPIELLELAPVEMGRRSVGLKRQLVWISGVMFYETPRKDEATLFTPHYGVDARFENKAAAETSEKVMTLPQIDEHQYTAIANAIASGNWEGVDMLARRQLEESRNDLNLLFYAGIANYKLGRFEEAKLFFQAQALSSISAFEQDRLFYYAASVYLSGDTLNGSRWLRQISEENGYYKLRADKLLME